jgi:hypothetical protein
VVTLIRDRVDHEAPGTTAPVDIDAGLGVIDDQLALFGRLRQ